MRQQQVRVSINGLDYTIGCRRVVIRNEQPSLEQIVLRARAYSAERTLSDMLARGQGLAAPLFDGIDAKRFYPSCLDVRSTLVDIGLQGSHAGGRNTSSAGTPSGAGRDRKAGAIFAQH